MTNELYNKTVIIIPIRMGSTRLPGKFHADINGKEMILHVIDCARSSGFDNIYVACDHLDHFNLVKSYNCNAVMTATTHQSGSDRVYEALQIIDPENKYEYIVNLQGDMPIFSPEIITKSVSALRNDSKADIATILAPMTEQIDIDNPNIVKAVFNNHHHALYFSRSPIPYSIAQSNANYFYHLGIYAYTRNALGKFISLAQSSLEIAERLEQLRALENGMTIKVDFINELPISVDTPEDLEKARNIIK